MLAASLRVALDPFRRKATSDRLSHPWCRIRPLRHRQAEVLLVHVQEDVSSEVATHDLHP
eukprot:12918924-Prorocentrum_lima.AAC.1